MRNIILQMDQIVLQMTYKKMHRFNDLFRWRFFHGAVRRANVEADMVAGDEHPLDFGKILRKWQFSNGLQVHIAFMLSLQLTQNDGGWSSDAPCRRAIFAYTCKFMMIVQKVVGCCKQKLKMRARDRDGWRSLAIVSNQQDYQMCKNCEKPKLKCNATGC